MSWTCTVGCSGYSLPQLCVFGEYCVIFPDTPLVSWRYLNCLVLLPTSYELLLPLNQLDTQIVGIKQTTCHGCITRSLIHFEIKMYPQALPNGSWILNVYSCQGMLFQKAKHFKRVITTSYVSRFKVQAVNNFTEEWFWELCEHQPAVCGAAHIPQLPTW